MSLFWGFLIIGLILDSGFVGCLMCSDCMVFVSCCVNWVECLIGLMRIVRDVVEYF